MWVLTPLPPLKWIDIDERRGEGIGGAVFMDAMSGRSGWAPHCGALPIGCRERRVLNDDAHVASDRMRGAESCI